MYRFHRVGNNVAQQSLQQCRRIHCCPTVLGDEICMRVIEDLMRERFCREQAVTTRQISTRHIQTVEEHC